MFRLTSSTKASAKRKLREFYKQPNEKRLIFCLGFGRIVRVDEFVFFRRVKIRSPTSSDDNIKKRYVL
jgi:hypothetical protein